MSKQYAPANLDIYDFFLIYAKKRRNQGTRKANTWLRKKLHWIMEETSLNRGEFALYVHEKGSWYNWLSPYTLRNGVYDLSTPSRKWKKYLAGFLKQSALVGYKFIPILNFREQYGGRPFHNNLNGVKGYLDRKGWKYQAKTFKFVARKLGRFYDDPEVKLSNEFSHAGSKEAGVEYCLWHEFMWDCIKGHVGLNRVICDDSGSDFMKLQGQHVLLKAPLPDRRRLLMKKEYDALPDPKPEYYKWFGRDEFAGREAFLEWHVMPAKLDQDVEAGANRTYWDVACSPSYHNIIFSGDGNNKGSGYQIPGTNFVEPSDEELYGFGLRLYQHCEAHPKKHFIPTAFPFHIIYEAKPGWYTTDIDLLDTAWAENLHRAWVDAGRPAII